MLALSSSQSESSRTLTHDQPILSTQLRGWQQHECKTVLTQIYEVATPAEAEAISAIGVDHVGVLVGEVPSLGNFRFRRRQPL
jgi:hypothetical protein